MEGKTNRELQALLEVQDHKIKQLEQRITTAKLAKLRAPSIQVYFLTH